MQILKIFDVKEIFHRVVLGHMRQHRANQIEKNATYSKVTSIHTSFIAYKRVVGEEWKQNLTRMRVQVGAVISSSWKRI